MKTKYKTSNGREITNENKINVGKNTANDCKQLTFKAVCTQLNKSEAQRKSKTSQS